MLDAGYWMLDSRYSMLDSRCWILDARYSMLDARYWILDDLNIQYSQDIIENRVSRIEDQW